MTATLVLHWALDALGDRVQAVDSSPNHLNGMANGSPDNLPDERFGSCLAFDGKYDMVGSPTTPQLRLPAYTLEAWVLPDRQAVQNVGVTGMPTRQFRLIINGSSFEHRFSTLGAPDDGHVLKVPVKFGAWQHVAVTFDGGTARAYVDGVDAGTYTTIRPRDAREAPLFAGTDGVAGFFAGRLAHVRLYSGALTAAEVARDMADDEAALAAFVRSHPIDFNLWNPDQSAVLYITDDPAGQPMNLRLTNSSREDVEFGPLTGTPAENNHHFALRFRPGTLAPAMTVKTTAAGWALQRSLDGSTIYLTATALTRIPRGQSVDLPLTGMNADGSSGTRGTRVELTYRGVRQAGQPAELTGNRLQFLDVVNHRGRKDIPLVATFVGGERVINDGATEGKLRIRIANSSRDKPISLKGATFTVSYETQLANESRPWALSDAGKTGVAQLAVESTDKVTGTIGATPPADLGARKVWTLKSSDGSIAADGSFTLLLSRLVGLPAPGHAAIDIAYQDVPGYQDGSLRVVAERSPLLFADQSVCIGSQKTDARLTVSAPTAHLQLRREATLGGGGKQLFLELFQDTTTGDPVTYPSIRFHHGQKFWHRIEARPEGIMFKHGDLLTDRFINIFAGEANVTSLRIGSTVVTERELALLVKLVAGALQFDLLNVTENEFAFVGEPSFLDTNRRHVISWPNKGQRVPQGRWQISFPS